jgi:hypothetical protein
MKNKIRLVDRTILSGQTSSSALTPSQLRFLSAITIEAPDTLPETVNIETSADGSSWSTFQSPPGTDVVIGAGKSISILEVSFRYLRVTATVGVAADRAFLVSATEEI